MNLKLLSILGIEKADGTTAVPLFAYFLANEKAAGQMGDVLGQQKQLSEILQDLSHDD